MSRVFISYRRTDKDFVDTLVGDLEKHHFPIWIDRKSIALGEPWQRAILETIETNTSVLIVVLSPSAIQSEWIGIEYDLALDKGITVIPYIYQPCEVPARLTHLQSVKHSNPNAFNDLVGRIQKFVFDNSALEADLIINKNQTFEELSNQIHGSLKISVSPTGTKLRGIPLGAVNGCLAYLIGREDDNLSPTTRIQLALQFSGSYTDDDFVRKIAGHFLEIDAGYKLRILLVRGPLQRSERDGKLLVNHGLEETKDSGEWSDAINAIDYLIRTYKKKVGLEGMQIFFQGPSVLMYKVGQTNRDMIPTEIYHWVRESKRTYYIRVFGNLD